MSGWPAVRLGSFASVRSTSPGLNQPVTGRDERVTMTPDIAVATRASDYFAGADPTLEAAMKALTANRQ